MRIAHVTDCYLPRLGGIELQVHGLACRQLANGHDVSVVTSVDADGDTAGGSADVVVHRPGRAGVSAGAIRYARSLRGRNTVLDGGFDLVHVHASTFSPLGFLAAAAASRAGIPTAFTAHSLWSYATPAFAAADRLLGWADWPIAWSAVSTVAAEPLRRVLRGRAEVAVVPNGIDPSAWPRRHSDPSGRDIRLISVMRLAPRKRPRALLSLLRDLAGDVGPSVRLRAEIIGEGPERATLERYLRRHDMTSWVSLPGRATRAQIGAALARSDIFIAPATLESFGIAALEARSVGLPVVARSGTGIADFITHRLDGVLASSDSEMAAAIAELIRSPGLRARITAHNRRVPPAVTWDAVLASCDALYAAAVLAKARHEGHEIGLDLSLASR